MKKQLTRLIYLIVSMPLFVLTQYVQAYEGKIIFEGEIVDATCSIMGGNIVMVNLGEMNVNNIAPYDQLADKMGSVANLYLEKCPKNVQLSFTGRGDQDLPHALELSNRGQPDAAKGVAIQPYLLIPTAERWARAAMHQMHYLNINTPTGIGEDRADQTVLFRDIPTDKILELKVGGELVRTSEGKITPGKTEGVMYLDFIYF